MNKTICYLQTGFPEFAEIVFTLIKKDLTCRILINGIVVKILFKVRVGGFLSINEQPLFKNEQFYDSHAQFG